MRTGTLHLPWADGPALPQHLLKAEEMNVYCQLPPACVIEEVSLDDLAVLICP